MLLFRITKSPLTWLSIVGIWCYEKVSKTGGIPQVFAKMSEQGMYPIDHKIILETIVPKFGEKYRAHFQDDGFWPY